jgi:AcrR family transcriptional regulator
MAASLKRTSLHPRVGSAQLPRGRHGLSRQFVLENQRERILDAMVHTAARRGYAEVAVADVIKRAGVSRKTFYENFKSKEDCFLTAYGVLVGRLSARAVDAYEQSDSWTDGIRGALRALLQMLSQDPALARVAMVEILAAGPRALERYDQAMHRILPILELGRAESAHGAELPPKLAEEILGGVTQTIYLSVLEGKSGTLEDSLQELLYFTLVPFLGHERALRAAFSEPA